MKQPPVFVSFTGADEVELLPKMQELSQRYPLEWGILVDEEKAGTNLFPSVDGLSQILATPGLRLAAHVCGEQASFIANSPEKASVNLSGFQRVQVNHGFSGSSPEQVENTVRFGRANGIRTMLQTVSSFPDDNRLDWLFDVSFGTGKSPTEWPSISENSPLCGFSGGIKPENVGDILQAIDAPAGAQYWIDMESGVRTEGKFDISRCEAVCRAVYG